MKIDLQTQADSKGHYPMQCDFSDMNTPQEVLRGIGLCIRGLLELSSKIGYDAHISNDDRKKMMFPDGGYGEKQADGLVSTYEFE